MMPSVAPRLPYMPHAFLPRCARLRAAASFLLSAAFASAQTVVTSNTSYTTSPNSLGDTEVHSGATLAVSGSGAINTGQFLIGGNTIGDTGALSVTGGGDVVSTWIVRVGHTSGATGTATIDGSGSTLTASGSYIEAGYAGTGSLTISNGGAVSTVATFAAGILTGSSGTLNLSGTGSSLTTADFLYAGYLGSGTLNISGGTLNVGTNLALGVLNGGSGTLNLTGGTLNLGGTDALQIGAGTGTVNFGGGTLRATAALTSSVPITLTSSTTSTVNTNGYATTLSGDLSGGGALTKSGTGTLTLTGANTYSGGTTLSGGTLALGSSGAIGSSGTISFAGGTLQYSASNTTDYSARFATTAGQAYSIDTNNQNVTFATALTSTGGSLAKLGAGTLTLASGTSLSGALAVSAGTLVLSSNYAFPDSPVTIASGATLSYNFQHQSFGSLAGAGTLTTGNSGTYVGSDNSSTTFSGVYSGTYRFEKRGTGTLTLTGANTFSGEVTVSDGTLVLSGSGATLPASNISVRDASLRIENGVVLSSTDLGLVSDYGRTSSIEITGTGSSVTSTQVAFYGFNTDHILTLSAGGQLTTRYLAVNFSDSSSTNTVSIGTDSRLAIVTDGSIINDAGYAPVRLSFSGGTLALGNNTQSDARLIVGASGGTVEVASGTSYFYGDSWYGTDPLTGTGTLTKTGTGTLVVTPDASAFAGTTAVSAGSIYLTGLLGGDISIGSGAAFTFARGGVATHAGDISGAGTLQRHGSGATILTGAATHTGGTAILQGGLQVGNGGTTGSLAGNVTTSAGTTFALSRSDAVTFSGVISGSGEFYKLGSGTTTLSATHTYTGATHVNAGTLLIDGSLADTAVNVASGATLGGTGTLGGTVSLASGAHLAPGNSPGTLTLANGLTLASGSILDFELGPVSDVLRITGGTLTGPTSGTVTLNLTDAGGFAPATYTLFDFSGATTSNFDVSDFVFGTTIAGYDYSLNLVGDTLHLTATASAIPEPSTYAVLAGLAALGLAALRRSARGRAQ